MDGKDARFLTIKQLAMRWKLSNEAISRALREGHIRGWQLRPKSDWRIPLDEIRRIEEQR